MLAYLFWHWPQPRIGPEVYERRLIDFHQALAASPPPGFQRSVVYRLQGAPGLGDQRRGYEDWYLVEDSAALDPLNEAAVSGTIQEPHDRVAHLADGGAGGLYRLVAGAPALTSARWTAWFAKPDGTSYADLRDAVVPWTSQPGHALWQRQMVLSPAPEFALLCPVAPELPAQLAALLVPLDPVRI